MPGLASNQTRSNNPCQLILSGLLLIAIGTNASPAAAQTDADLTLSPPAASIGPARSRSAGPNIAQHVKEAVKAPDKMSPMVRGLTSQAGKSRTAPMRSSQLLRVRDGDRVQVYVSLNSTAPEVLQRLRELGADIEVVLTSMSKAQLWISTGKLEELATLEEVEKISLPGYATPRTGNVNSEGVAILRSNTLLQLGLRGQGVRVGVVSDGANSLSSAQAGGNLPPSVKRYGSCTVRSENISACLSRKTCNEGTAMAEIIHDIAPDAELAVAAVSTSLEFIQRINQLASDFKADIIVDDLGFFGEPYFADGDIAKAVAALPSNVLYISSAGNSGNTHHEKNFTPQLFNNTEFHAFAGSDFEMGFAVRPRSYAFVIMQWNDSFAAPESDFDMAVLNLQGQTTGVSVRDQASGAQPIEAICVPNTSSVDAVNFLRVDRFSGPDKRLELFFLGASAIEHNTPAGSIFGHAATSRALAVATINAGDPGNNNIAFYSSRGPARIDFPSVSERRKPDLTGVDGVSVSGAGGFPSQFFGTSAAAPHVAGVAAQLMSVSTKVRAINVKRALSSGAFDLGAAGQDSTFGAGRVDAARARELLREGVILPPFLLFDD